MIEELNRFLLVAREGNLTRAAEKIFITQPALTQSIQRLEKALGVNLFVQNGKYLLLTTEGAEIRQIAEKIIDLWERAKDNKKRGNLKKKMTVGMFDNAGLKLAGFLKDKRTESDYRLEFVIDNSSRLISKLRLGLIDLAVLVKGKNTDGKDLDCLRSFSESLVPVGGKIFTEDVSSVPFILYNRGSNTREQIDAEFVKKGISPLVFSESTSDGFMKELAILNCGVAILPENTAQQEIASGILKKQKFNIDWRRKYGLYILRDRKKDIDIELVEAIAGELKTLGERDSIQV